MYMPIAGIELVIVMLNSFKLLWGKKSMLTNSLMHTNLSKKFVIYY